MTTDATTVARTWIAAIAVAILVALWSLLARTPYPARPAATSEPAPASTRVTTVDPRVLALQRRERLLRRRAAAVQRRHAQQWASYRQAVRERDAQAAAAATTFVWSSSSGGGGSSASAPAASAPVVQTRSS